MATKSKSAKYYASHPEAKAKKARYDTKLESKPAQVQKRVEANAYNRAHGTVGDGRDASHRGGRVVGLEAASVNRGRAEKSRLKGSKRK